MPPVNTRKSRTGCRNCKNRHIKCDETTPSCINCTTTRCHCSYLSLVARTSALPQLRLPRPPLAQTRISPISTAVASLSSQNQTFNVQDIALFHHFGDGFAECMLNYHPSAEQLLRLASTHALEAPYLLNQLLAISAAHLGSTRSDNQSYRRDATVWQTRALNHFNTIDPNAQDGQGWVSTFFFSVFLSHQALLELSSIRDDLATFLTPFVGCLGLHRGVHAITSRYWPSVEPRLLPHLDATFVKAIGAFQLQSVEDRGRMDGLDRGNDFHDLFTLLDTTVSNQSGLSDVLRQAISSLQRVINISRSDTSRRVRAIVSWMVLVTQDFSRLLETQQPEALVVLAHYGIALDSIRDYWAVRDMGQYIIRSVVQRLDEEWHVWLAWPIQKLAEAEGRSPAGN